MRVVCLLTLLIAGCQREPGGDTPVDSDPSVVRDSAAADSEAWDTGLGEWALIDTFTRLDDPIGPTSLDGTWNGTFTFEVAMPPLANNPTCVQGRTTVTISGEAPRHVIAEFDCGQWRPNAPDNALFDPLGPLRGVGFATLNPSRLDRFELDLVLGAGGMTAIDESGIVARVNGELLTIEHDGIRSIGPLRSGFNLTLTAERGAAPVLPVDTGDSDPVDTDLVDTDTDAPDSDSDAQDSDTDGPP